MIAFAVLSCNLGAIYFVSQNKNLLASYSILLSVIVAVNTAAAFSDANSPLHQANLIAMIFAVLLFPKESKVRKAAAFTICLTLFLGFELRHLSTLHSMQNFTALQSNALGSLTLSVISLGAVFAINSATLRSSNSNLQIKALIRKLRAGEQKQISRAEELAATIDALPDLCLKVSSDFVTKEVSNAASAIWRRTLKDVGLKHIISSELWDAINEACEHVKATGKVQCLKFCYKKYNYSFQMEARVSANGLNARNGYVVLIRNETAFQHDHELVEKNRIKLFESAKMATLGEMAGNIAHEINNPLTVIIGLAELSIAEIEDISAELLASSQIESLNSCQQISKSLKKIISTSNRISKIVIGLKHFARDGKKEICGKVSVQSVIEETLAMCESNLLSKGIKLILEDHPAHLDQVYAKHIQLSQIFMNLFSNSADAISDASEKWLRIRFEELADSTLNILIIDSGSGIPPEIQAKIFEPFYTSKEVGKGTGLGLSISKEIARSFGGDLFVDSSHANTCFRLQLKLFDEQQKCA